MFTINRCIVLTLAHYGCYPSLMSLQIAERRGKSGENLRQLPTAEWSVNKYETVVESLMLLSWIVLLDNSSNDSYKTWKYEISSFVGSYFHDGYMLMLRNLCICIKTTLDTSYFLWLHVCCDCNLHRQAPIFKISYENWSELTNKLWLIEYLMFFCKNEIVECASSVDNCIPDFQESNWIQWHLNIWSIRQQSAMTLWFWILETESR